MTEIEAGYIAQGYQLPAGWTWHDVAAQRAKYGVSEIAVPLACGPNVVAWGVPIVGGKFMAHE